MDSYNYKNINNPKARQVILNIINDYNLIDAFRTFHPKDKRYSWRKKNPIKQARLDYFLISDKMTNIVDNCMIRPSYRSDHSIVELDIIMNNLEIGKGIWKLNVSLLKNIGYINLINNVIDEEKHKYVLPVYDPDYLKNTYKNVTFTIDPDLFLEILYLRIRSKTIKFASLLKKNNNRREKEIIKDIEIFELQNDSLYSSNLLDQKQELESLRAVRVQGQIVRSRMQSLSEGEKPTKFFCKMENRNYLAKNI